MRQLASLADTRSLRGSWLQCAAPLGGARIFFCTIVCGALNDRHVEKRAHRAAAFSCWRPIARCHTHLCLRTLPVMAETAAVSDADVQRVLAYIERTWPTLTRSHKNLREAVEDNKVTASQNGAFPLFVSNKEDKEKVHRDCAHWGSLSDLTILHNVCTGPCNYPQVPLIAAGEWH